MAKSRIIFLFVTILAVFPYAYATDTSQPLSLNDCYKLALKQSERIAIQQELITEAEAHFTLGLSGVLPRASFYSSDKKQDGSGSSAFTLRKVPERKFVLSQPLFAGFKEFAAMSGSRAEKQQRTYEKMRAEQLLFVDVSDAYHLLLEQREDLATLEMISGILSQRLEELRGRERLGRSRASEVVSIEAQRLRVEAELELVSSQEMIALQLLEFLTGLDHIEAIQVILADTPTLGREATYTGKVPDRPDIRAAEQASIVAKKQVAIAKGDFWPTVSLDGNYYTERVGVAKDVSWDAALVVSVPIFDGGQTIGNVKQAQSAARQIDLQTAEVKRRAALDIRDAYVALEKTITRHQALAKALEASNRNFELQSEDYRRSLVSNLDVLQALQSLEDARRDFIHVQYETQRNYWRLKAAVGEIDDTF